MLLETLLVLSAVLAVFKIWMRLTTGVCRSSVRLHGKTAVITGANSGVGYETALDLARRGARVVMVCRDMDKGQQALNTIRSLTHNDNLVLRHMDLASLASVRLCAEQISKEEEAIDILLNNAGVASGCFTRTADGLDTLMQTNYFGPFLFTEMLKDRMVERGRIVFVSSESHKLLTSLHVDQLATLSNITSSSTSRAYATSKLCNILNANYLAATNSGFTVNSVTPGVVLTDILRNSPAWFRVPHNLFAKYFLKTPVEGAQTCIYGCISRDLDNMTGAYFKDCQLCPASALTRSTTLTQELYQKTHQIIELCHSEYAEKVKSGLFK